MINYRFYFLFLLSCISREENRFCETSDMKSEFSVNFYKFRFTKQNVNELDDLIKYEPVNIKIDSLRRERLIELIKTNKHYYFIRHDGSLWFSNGTCMNHYDLFQLSNQYIEKYIEDKLVYDSLILN